MHHMNQINHHFWISIFIIFITSNNRTTHNSALFVNGFTPSILSPKIRLNKRIKNRNKANNYNNHNMNEHSLSSTSSTQENNDQKPHCTNVLFIECGFGNDSHGQSATKAAVRACRNAIEFNSIPSINRLVPGGYNNLKLDVLLAVPPKYQKELDLEAVRGVFPYGDVKFTIQDGGMIAPSGIAIDTLGDKNDDMVVVCASVTVGF